MWGRKCSFCFKHGYEEMDLASFTDDETVTVITNEGVKEASGFGEVRRV